MKLSNNLILCAFFLLPLYVLKSENVEKLDPAIICEIVDFRLLFVNPDTLVQATDSGAIILLTGGESDLVSLDSSKPLNYINRLLELSGHEYVIEDAISERFRVKSLPLAGVLVVQENELFRFRLNSPSRNFSISDTLRERLKPGDLLVLNLVGWNG